jgi:response regulator of citrate/malate metabolism
VAGLEHVIRTIIVDDDFMIARLHGRIVEEQAAYKLIGTASNYESALQTIEEKKPDLLILDVYLPDRSGLDLLADIRTRKMACDVILITAAKEVEVVEISFRYGVFDYLLKPFHLDRLRNSLTKYIQFRARLSTSMQMDQGVVDHLNNMRSVPSSNRPTESGIDPKTLLRIKQCLQGEKAALSAEEVAKRTGVSRSTARTYLVHLVESDQASEELIYGTIGRPRRLYLMR